MPRLTLQPLSHAGLGSLFKFIDLRERETSTCCVAVPAPTGGSLHVPRWGEPTALLCPDDALTTRVTQPGLRPPCTHPSPHTPVLSAFLIRAWKPVKLA